MKIREGRYYKTRDGRKVGPMAGGEVFFWVDGKSVDPAPEWRPDGTPTQDGVELFGMTDNDTLIAEWTDEPRPWGELTDAEKGALLLAAHNGKAIEFSCEGRDPWVHLTWDFDWIDEHTYRIKPEPVVETVTLYGVKDVHYGYHFSTKAGKELRLTFTTKDGEPDCDSVKMERIND